MAELESVRAGIDDILGKRVTGFIIRGVFDPKVLARAIERLESEACPIRRFGKEEDRDQSDRYAGCSYGLPLTNCQEDLTLYFDCARELREASPGLFDGATSPEDQLTRVLATLADKPARVVPGPGDATYTPVTYRKLFPSSMLSIHRGNEFHEWTTFRDLVTRIGDGGQMSFFTPMAMPPQGGELHIYPGYFSPDERSRMDGLPESHLAELNASLGAISVRPDVGDLLVFDGGRYLHRVAEVRGGDRWTMGGFLAHSSDGSEVLFWS